MDQENLNQQIEKLKKQNLVERLVSLKPSVLEGVPAKLEKASSDPNHTWHNLEIGRYSQDNFLISQKLVSTWTRVKDFFAPVISTALYIKTGKEYQLVICGDGETPEQAYESLISQFQ